MYFPTGGFSSRCTSRGRLAGLSGTGTSVDLLFRTVRSVFVAAVGLPLCTAFGLLLCTAVGLLLCTAVALTLLAAAGCKLGKIGNPLFGS